MAGSGAGLKRWLLLIATSLLLGGGGSRLAALAGEGAKRGVTLALGGDVMLARLVTRTLLEQGPRHVWGDVLPLLRGADLTLVNLECQIAESGRRFTPRRVFYFRAHPRAIDALTVAGIDCVSLANNHAVDYGAPALLETLRRLDEAGVAHAGAGPDLAAASRPALLAAGGLRIGVVSFADHFRLYAARAGRAGTNVISISREERHFGRVRRAIDAARSAGADLVVFSIHWGPNMRPVPTTEFRRFARAVMDAGADVFHGHSAHVFQGIEIYRGKPILYDTGDLLDDYRVHPELRNDRQLLFVLTVARDGVRRLELVPLRISDMQVNRARGADLRATLLRMTRLSADLGTVVEERGGRLVIDVARPAVQRKPAN
ncbi:MAG: CapA family protein [Planctomycetota bacterium]